MRGKTTHPGVSISQRAKGGTWFIRFFDARSGERVQVSKSTHTDDYDIATRIAQDIYSFLKTPEAWENVPDGYQARSYELLGVQPQDSAAKTLNQSIRYLGTPARMMGLDPSPTENRAKKAIDEFQDALKRAKQSADAWKRRAIAAEGQLARQGKQFNKARASIEGLTLATALETWSKTLTGDVDYVKNQQNDAAMFVRQFGGDTALTDIVGRETEIDVWIRNLKRQGGKRDGQSVGASRRQELRRVVLRFMRESGAAIDGKTIKRPSIKDVRNDRGAIRWLTREQARNVANKIADPYYSDCFRLQLALGLRPDELITLKKQDFSEIDGEMSLTLSPLAHLTLKEGSRTVIVPEQVRNIVMRRLEANHILFPYKSKRCKKKGTPWPKAKNFDQLYLSALRVAGKAADIPFSLDCRIARRTCATLLLGAGTTPKAVADILGDNLQTVLEHYAAAIPGTNDPSAAAIS